MRVRARDTERRPLLTNLGVYGFAAQAGPVRASVSGTALRPDELDKATPPTPILHTADSGYASSVPSPSRYSQGLWG